MNFEQAIAVVEGRSAPDPGIDMSALTDFVTKVQRDIAAEIDVTRDHALVVGWPDDQLVVTKGHDARMWLSATDGRVEVYRLVEVWLEVEDGQMALSVKRAAKMPDPVAKKEFYPVTYGKKQAVLNAYDDVSVEQRCRAIVARGTKPTLLEVRPLIESFYKLEGNGAGGSLHIVLDDNNVQLPHIQWCAEQAEAKGDTTAVWLARVLCMLSASQRRRM